MLNVKKDDDRKIRKKEHKIKFNNNDLLYKLYYFQVVFTLSVLSYRE